MTDTKATKKERFDYSTIGLVKKEDKVTFNEEGIDVLTSEVKDWLANYGTFVYLTRLLAGHEKDTLAEKKAIVQEGWNWLVDGMPARTRARVDGKTAAVNELLKQLEVATDTTTNAILQGVIDKMRS